jgi:hypothetical protein
MINVDELADQSKGLDPTTDSTHSLPCNPESTFSTTLSHIFSRIGQFLHCR